MFTVAWVGFTGAACNSFLGKSWSAEQGKHDSYPGLIFSFIIFAVCLWFLILVNNTEFKADPNDEEHMIEVVSNKTCSRAVLDQSKSQGLIQVIIQPLFWVCFCMGLLKKDECAEPDEEMLWSEGSDE
eukprot:gnl/TRDRNA2_/TRDRNA2_100041_c0_seq1.p1 gnl/TRDRNA2_/TRDRNA2_100041_c0~~gnl/TRDRNA2_/TRDRNA2_100041_c0_seq1.p1  ORF type:complete len:147 (+),score=22.56 gnl/TRDRNA2_/TRDRNA2_100041_c0_seq1:60-443(+)